MFEEIRTKLQDHYIVLAAKNVLITVTPRYFLTCLLQAGLRACEE